MRNILSLICLVGLAACATPTTPVPVTATGFDQCACADMCWKANPKVTKARPSKMDVPCDCQAVSKEKDKFTSVCHAPDQDNPMKHINSQVDKITRETVR